MGFAAWLIATEILIFDQVSLRPKAKLLEEAARALRGPRLIAPGERSLKPSGNAKMERL
jgi:hypothetical protein